MKCTRRARRGLAGLVIGILGLALAGCTLPLSTPGATAKIALVSTATVDDWRYDFYRNWDCPCSISGYRTFTVGTKVGSADTKLDNEPDKLVTRGVLTVPLMHIWNISDPSPADHHPCRARVGDVRQTRRDDRGRARQHRPVVTDRLQRDDHDVGARAPG